MDNGLRVQWPGGDQTFAPGTSVVIGRDVGLELTSDNPTVSRRHAEVSFDGTAWVLRDLDSTQGTYVDGRRVAMHTISGTTTLVLGDPRTGETVSLTVAADESTAMNRPASASPAPGPGGSAAPGTVIVGGPERPGGRLQENQVNGATVVTGQTVNIECGGRNYSFEPGTPVTVGRDDHCDIVVANPTVSRRHATLSYGSGSWSVDDEGSSSGTFIDGKRITAAKLSGTTAVFLGGQEAGERMVVVTSGATRPSSTSSKGGALVLLGVGVVAVLVVAMLGAWFVLGGGGPDDNQLAQATVLIMSDQSSGSGSVIDAELGLILTNAHVADPTAPGVAVLYGSPASQEEEPEELLIFVAPGLDKAAEPKYIAEVVASDGYLDLAVLKITKTGRGALIEDGDLDGLVEVEVGDSETVKSGSDVSVFGYPGAAESSAVSLTTGVVSAGVQDNRLSDNRAFFNVDAQINPGNSGGLAANDDGLLIGVPTLTRSADTESVLEGVRPVSSIRPINFAKPLIEEAQGGADARSPSNLRVLKDEAIDPDSISIAAVGSEAGADFDACSPGTAVAGDGAVALSFDFEGFADGKHQDVMIWVYDSEDRTVGSWSARDEYPLKWPESGCATLSVPLGTDLVAGSYGAMIFLGPDYEVVADVGFDVA